MPKVESYLKALSDIQEPQNYYYEWQLENLKPVKVVDSSDLDLKEKVHAFDLKAKECFTNAIIVACLVPGVKYCEGYIFHHIPLDHAWNSYRGHYFDVTSEKFFGGEMGKIITST